LTAAGPIIIAGDWGTSHLRLFLCEGTRTLASLTGPGVGPVSMQTEAAAPGSSPTFAQILSGLVADWVSRHGAVPVWLSGMVGSRSGWREIAYLPCPVDTATLARAVRPFAANGLRIAIVPGLSCTNSHGAPDVMRGEETQIIGALARYPELNRGRRIFCLPGTHSKWVTVEDGRILAFQTSFSGELYQLLTERSTLTRALTNSSNAADRAGQTDEPSGAPEIAQRSAFEAGYQRVLTLPGVPLSYLLFEVRSRQLAGELSRMEALAFLSGLVIGQDIQGATGLLRGAATAGQRVAVVGAPHLTELYRQVLASHGVSTLLIEASEATVSGLSALAVVQPQKETSRVH